MNLESQIVSIAVAFVFTVLGAWLSTMWPQWRDNRAYRKQKRLIGEWISSWTDASRQDWVRERLTIGVDHGKIVLKNSENSDGYEWSGEGQLFSEGKYCYGTLKSIKQSSNSTGVFIFFVLSQGDAMVGQAFGLDKESNVRVWNWALGREDASLRRAKAWLTSNTNQRPTGAAPQNRTRERRRNAEQGGTPNGGPAAAVDYPNTPGGPPSVT